MSESSTEQIKTPEESTGVPAVAESKESTKEPKQVPVEAVAKERAEKRAARAEVKDLREDKERRDEFDEELIEQLARQAKEAVDREMEPLRTENTRLKMAVDHGLSGEQADKVMELQTKNPALSLDQSLTLARVDNPTLFPSQSSQVPAGHRGLPTTGDSQVRAATDKSDFTKLMHEARASGNVAEATRNAALAFEQRFQLLRNSARQ